MKEDILVSDYISKRQEELDEQNEKVDKSNKKALTWVVLFVSIMIVVSAGIIMADKIITVSKHNRYVSNELKSEDLANDISMLEYEDTYELYEKSLLGNDNNNLINYGYFASRNGYRVYVDLQSGATKLENGNQIKQLSTNKLNYINITNDAVYFRSSENRKIYSCDLNGENIHNVLDIKSGQVLVSDGIIYYVNFEDGGKLYAYNISNEDNKKIIDEKVQSFAQVGKLLIYLDSENNLKKYKSGSAVTTIQQNIEKFYYNGKIIAQNNGQILTFTIRGTNPKCILKDNVELLSADKQYIYYIKDTELYKIDSNGKEDKITDECDFYKAIYKTENGFYIVGNITDGENYKEKILIISGE